MSESKDPPDLPQIVDEAADSPSWLPLVGLALLCAVALLISVSQALAPSTSTAPTEAAQDGATPAEALAAPAEAVH